MGEKDRTKQVVIKRLLISTVILTGLTMGVEVTAHADTSAPVSQTGDVTAPVTLPSDSGKNNDASTVKSTHPVTIIPKVGNTVHLDNQLIISTSKDQTLKDVTVTGGSYDKDKNIATLDNPTVDSQFIAKYNQVGTYHGQAVSAVVTVDHIQLHNTDHVTPKITMPDKSTIPVSATQAAIIFGKSFGLGVDTYNVAEDELHVTFFDAQGKEINLSDDAYITVGSLNGPTAKIGGNEYVDYTSYPSDKAYQTADTVVVPMTNPNTNTGVVFAGKSSDFTDVLGAPTSENGAITFAVNGSDLTFLNGTTRMTCTAMVIGRIL